MELGLPNQRKSEGANPGTHGPDEVVKSDLPLVHNHEHVHTITRHNVNSVANEFGVEKK